MNTVPASISVGIVGSLSVGTNPSGRIVSSVSVSSITGGIVDRDDVDLRMKKITSRSTSSMGTFFIWYV